MSKLIPNAEVLASILNDPEIPEEALPRTGHYLNETIPGTGGRLKRWVPENDLDTNYRLFWSLWEWVLSRDRGVPAIGMDRDGNIGIARGIVRKTPVEAVAALVRELSTGSTKNT
jgi:hypothetical protein